jgi:hypothetical protein
MTQAKSASNAPMDGWLVAAGAVGRTPPGGAMPKAAILDRGAPRLASSMVRLMIQGQAVASGGA